MRGLPILTALLLCVPAPAAAIGGSGWAFTHHWTHPPFTLFPAPPVPGEKLACVMPAPVHTWPYRDTEVLSELASGDEVRVEGRVTAAGVPWILTEGGWVEAARLDRAPRPRTGDLAAGREGMISGRVVAGEWCPSDLASVPDSLKASGYERRAMRLRRDALTAFRRMIDAARTDGIRIGIVSAYRGADRQRRLYAKAVERDPRQRHTAAPGRSEHRLGTTVDVAVPSSRPLREELADTPAGRWLARRAADFGIVATYSRERHERRGVAHEPWHLRWVADRTGDESGW